MDSKTSPLISFIIPVYNVEKYLDSCLLSIDNQGLNDDEYEVILVNDGSTDQSYRICKKWEKERTNYHVLDQNNQGIGCARNAGIKVATGRFVLFVDSDDLLIPQSIIQLVEYLDGRYDLLLGARISVKDDNFPETQEVSESNILFDGSGIEYLMQYSPLVYCTNCLILRSFLTEREIQFSNYVPGEDRLFMFHVLSGNPRLLQVKRPIYYYMMRSDSITHVKDKKRLATLARNQVEVFCQIARSMSTMHSSIRANGIESIQYNLIWVFKRLFLSDIKYRDFKSIVGRLFSIKVLPLKIKGEWSLLINTSLISSLTFYPIKIFFSVRSWLINKWLVIDSSL